MIGTTRQTAKDINLRIAKIQDRLKAGEDPRVVLAPWKHLFKQEDKQ